MKFCHKILETLSYGGNPKSILPGRGTVPVRERQTPRQIYHS